MEKHPNININVDWVGYEESNKLSTPRGADPALVKEGSAVTSLVNKLHLIKLAGDFPASDNNLASRSEFQAQTFTDLCRMEFGAQQYDADDFLYCKNLGFPINRLITLRRFPFPVNEDIYDKDLVGEPDISRMITYFDQNTNKLEDILSFSYGLRWKELTAEFEQAAMQGDQSGFTNAMKKMMTFLEPRNESSGGAGTLAQNALKGENKLNYDPKFDQNRVYGPVDSLTTTNIRDVGLEFSKEFEIQFDYELRSIGSRTPEFAFKDVLANVLACTYNNAKFWPGARYWVGEHPSNFYQHFKFMNPDSVDEFLFGSRNNLVRGLNLFKEGGLGTIKDIIKNLAQNSMAVGLGKLLDKVGRPSIPMMNSLLSGDATGYWHLTIGNPLNPIMVCGNLICTNVDVTFPTDELSYGDFPTKLQVKVKLKPGIPKDRAGIERMFNRGKSRIYYQPSEVIMSPNKNVISKNARNFFEFSQASVNRMIDNAFDFVNEGDIKAVSKTIKGSEEKPKIQNNQNSAKPQSENSSLIQQNADMSLA